MKKWIYLFLMGSICLPLQLVWAQEKPKTEERGKPGIPIKVQIVFTEFEGDKKISSMPYAFTVLAGETSGSGGGAGTSLRTGIRIPIETDGKDQKTTYMDVGSNMDCGVKREEDGSFRMNLIFERSALYPNKSSEGERLVAEPNGLPLVRQFRSNQTLLLKDGQTSESILSTDPLNGHTVRLSVTINAQR